MTQRQNTNNPCPSNALADLNDNTITIDEFVNSKSDYTTDRYGNQFKTKHKILNDLEKSISEIKNESFLPISGGTVNGSIDAAELTENGVRVYSPDNKPTADDIGSLPATKTVVNGVPTYNIDATSISVNGEPVLTRDDIKQFDERIYIIESYQNGDSWYNKYSNGFIEQSGVIKVTTSVSQKICDTLVNLLTPMETQNYSVITGRINLERWGDIYFSQSERNITNFHIASYGVAVGFTYVRWVVKGY